jgi:hypothetical protein
MRLLKKIAVFYSKDLQFKKLQNKGNGNKLSRGHEQNTDLSAERFLKLPRSQASKEAVTFNLLIANMRIIHDGCRA